MKAQSDGDEMEEELRLMYVACTRAKDHLFYHVSDKHL